MECNFISRDSASLVRNENVASCTRLVHPQDAGKQEGTMANASKHHEASTRTVEGRSNDRRDPRRLASPELDPLDELDGNLEPESLDSGLFDMDSDSRYFSG